MESNCLEAIASSLPRSLDRFTSQPLVQTPPLLPCEVCVIVPVRNEAETIQATLSALSHQVDQFGRPFDPARYEIVLLANNCTDDSAAIARQFACQHPSLSLHVVERTLPAAEAYVGRVRQLLMDEAYRRLMALGRKRGIIASTDGDTCVDRTWIAATLSEVGRGADAVGGRVMLDPRSRAALNPRLKAYYLRDIGYRFLIAELEDYLDPDPDDRFPRHHQHQGASFAVTAEMYALAGGMPAVRTPEDMAFYQALVRVGARFRHSPLVRVTTSGRQVGRTQIGLANQLQEWVAMGEHQQPLLVESAAAIETRLQLRSSLRQLWWQRSSGHRLMIEDVARTADRLGVPADWLSDELAQSHAFGLLWEQVEQHQQEGVWQQRWRLVKIEEAIADLRLRLYQLHQKSSIQSLPEEGLNSANLLGQLSPETV